MTITKYLNPRNDIAFKKIFGTEKNKDILIHFLNDVIEKEGKKEITNVTLLNPMQHPEIIGKKQSVVDVLCEEKDGTQYIVEMQVAKVAGFEKRAQYYAAKAYSAQPESGETYDHLKEVIFLAITEYEMFKDKEGYKSVHVILDKKTHERDLKDFSFTFLELKKFNKSKEELKTYEDKWLYFFKHANDPEDMHKLIENSDEVIKKAYHELEAHNWTNEELRAYEASEKSSKDAKAREQYVEQEGMKKGLEKGREEGGKLKATQIAKNLLVQKMDIKLISESTGLPVEEVKKLEKETNG
jgi:predicted transposase/invertase (TIGR01784 family)